MIAAIIAWIGLVCAQDLRFQIELCDPSIESEIESQYSILNLHCLNQISQRCRFIIWIESQFGFAHHCYSLKRVYVQHTQGLAESMPWLSRLCTFVWNQLKAAYVFNYSRMNSCLHCHLFVSVQLAFQVVCLLFKGSILFLECSEQFLQNVVTVAMLQVGTHVAQFKVHWHS